MEREGRATGTNRSNGEVRCEKSVRLEKSQGTRRDSYAC